MRGAFISGFVLSLLAVAFAEDEIPCTTHAKGKFYDLRPLKSNKDHEVVGLASKPIFPINVCQAVRTESFGIKDDIKDTEIAAFTRRGHGDFVLGKVNTTLDFYDNHPRIILSSGSRCKSDKGETQNIRGSAVVDFVCDPTVLSTGQPRLVAALPPGDEEEACAFVIEWRTQYACPASEGGILWTLFVTIAVVFLSLLLAYTALGTLYNRFVLQLRGFDQIPQFSIESMKYHATEGFDWAKDLYAIYGPGSSNSVFGVPNNAPNPVSHQASVGGVTGRHDLEAGQDSVMGTKAFSRPTPRTPMSANRSSAFARAPQRPETNPVSHQSQVNAELEHQRVQSLSQRSPIPSQASSAASTHLSFDSSPASPIHAAPLVSVSPALPEQPLPSVPTPKPAPISGSQQAKKGDKEFAVTNEGSEEEEDDDDDDEESEEESEQDYTEYNDVDSAGAKELTNIKGPGGPSGSS